MHGSLWVECQLTNDKWREQVDFCYRCCATWGETVIRVQCDKPKTNGTELKEHENKTVVGQEKDQQRELGLS